MRKFHEQDFVWMKITNPVVARVSGIFANVCLSYRTPIGREVFSLSPPACATPSSGPARELHHYAPDAHCCPRSSRAAPGGGGNRPPVALGRRKSMGHGKRRVFRASDTFAPVGAPPVQSRRPPPLGVLCGEVRRALYGGDFERQDSYAFRRITGGEALRRMHVIGVGTRDRISSATTDCGKSF